MRIYRPNTEYGDTLKGICLDSQRTYRTINRFDFKAEWIQDDQTAKKLLKWVAQYFSFKRFKIQFKSMLNNVHWEIGDLARFDLSLLGPNKFENIERVFILVGISLTPNKDEMELKWEEVPEEKVTTR